MDNIPSGLCCSCNNKTYNECFSCEKYCCFKCFLDCSECNVYSICKDCCIKNHQEKLCERCKEFGIINKTCICSRHFGNCIICGDHEVINTDAKCINYEDFVCRYPLTLCKKHFDMNNLTSKEEWKRYRKYRDTSGCDFCKRQSCYTCNSHEYNNFKRLNLHKDVFLICEVCDNIYDVFKEKFTYIETKILLEYLYGIL